MKSLVLFDSFFGNTEKVARAIAGTLPGEVQVMRIADAQTEQLAGLDVLLVGSPTRAFRPSPATSAFLKAIPAGKLAGVRVAAFDTRMDIQTVKSGFLKFMAGIFGYAAQPMGRALKKKGGTEVLPPEGFVVNDTEGPLKEGELERAAAWAKKIK